MKSESKCTGPTPANAHLIPGDDQGLTETATNTLVRKNSSKKCEYLCNDGYMYENGKCVSIARKCEVWRQNDQERSCVIGWVLHNLFRIPEGETWKNYTRSRYDAAEQDDQEIFQSCDTYAKNYNAELKTRIPNSQEYPNPQKTCSDAIQEYENDHQWCVENKQCNDRERWWSWIFYRNCNEDSIAVHIFQKSYDS